MRDPTRGQLAGGLVDELATVGDHQHTASGSRDDGCGDDGLTGAGRRDEQDGSNAALDVTLELGTDVVLVRTENGAHAANSASMGRNSTSENASAMIASTRSSP